MITGVYVFDMCCCHVVLFRSHMKDRVQSWYTFSWCFVVHYGKARVVIFSNTLFYDVISGDHAAMGKIPVIVFKPSTVCKL